MEMWIRTEFVDVGSDCNESCENHLVVASTKQRAIDVE
jgi:hypothetical protein